MKAPLFVGHGGSALHGELPDTVGFSSGVTLPGANRSGTTRLVGSGPNTRSPRLVPR